MDKSEVAEFLKSHPGITINEVIARCIAISAENEALRQRVAELEKQVPKWTPVDGVENVPKGNWLGLLAKERFGGRVHAINCRPNMCTVGGCFDFDSPKVIAYMPTPPQEPTP